MSVTSGFFNSKSGDRKYNADQMSALFDGIIRDGVFATVGQKFLVEPLGGLSVTVESGRAWFNRIWVDNDNLIDLTLSSSPSIQNRYDAVVIEVNKNDSVRSASIKVVTGTAASAPTKPSMIKTGNVYQYPIAYIYRKAGSTNITHNDIECAVGTAECPYVTAPLESVSIDARFAQWESEFNAWFDGLKDTLSENTEAQLKQDIIDLEVAVDQLRDEHPYWTEATVPVRRSTFRGHNLGAAVTVAQLQHIQAGSFYDLWLGDYWLINGVKWRIVDFDYWYGMGDTTKCTKHHVVVMPDTTILTRSMNSAATTSGGYFGSEMASLGIGVAWQDITNAFGSANIVTRRDYLSKAVTNGCVSDGGWYDRYIDAPNEIMIYGSFVHTPTNNGTRITDGDGSIVIKNLTTAKTQLALFRVAPTYIMADKSYWLRDVVSDIHFASVQGTGLASYTVANVNNDYTPGLRPVFAIG